MGFTKRVLVSSSVYQLRATLHGGSPWLGFQSVFPKRACWRQVEVVGCNLEGLFLRAGAVCLRFNSLLGSSVQVLACCAFPNVRASNFDRVGCIC